MSTATAGATEVKVPDIGDFSAVPIIEVHVAPGDKVNAEDPLLTLESDKATLDVPAPSAGTVAQVSVRRFAVGKPRSRPRWSPRSTTPSSRCGRPSAAVAARISPAFTQVRT